MYRLYSAIKFIFRPEAQGVVCGAVYLVLMFLFIPVLFYDRLRNTSTETFPFHEVGVQNI